MKRNMNKEILSGLVVVFSMLIACGVTALAGEGEKMPTLPVNSAAPGGMAGGNGGKGEWMEQLREKLKNRNPEEFERMRQLRESNPEQFRKEMRERYGFSKHEGSAGEDGVKRSSPSPEEAACRTIAEKYHAAKEPADKERLRTELKAAISAAFEKKLSSMRERLEKLEQMEKELQALREQLAKREKSRSQICEERLNELTRAPSLRW